MDLDLALVSARIAATVAAFRQVGEAAEYMTARESLKQSPSAFVIPVRDQAGENELENGISQLVRTRIGVMLAVQSLRDLSGEKAKAELRALRIAVRDSALFGWQPGADLSPFTYSGGRLVEMDLADRVIWWQDDYETDYYARRV